MHIATALKRPPIDERIITLSSCGLSRPSNSAAIRLHVVLLVSGQLNFVHTSQLVAFWGKERRREGDNYLFIFLCNERQSIFRCFGRSCIPSSILDTAVVWTVPPCTDHCRLILVAYRLSIAVCSHRSQPCLSPLTILLFLYPPFCRRDPVHEQNLLCIRIICSTSRAKNLPR